MTSYIIYLKADFCELPGTQPSSEC